MKKRLTYIDLLKVLASFLVVFLHVLTPSVVLYGQVPILQWDISILLSSFTRISIPIFILASGAVLLSKKEHVLETYKKRIIRIGVPLLAWFIFYAGVSSVVRGAPFTPQYLLSQFIFNQPYEHLYFLIILLELAFITPIFNLFLHQSKRVVTLFCILCLLCTFFFIPNRFVLSLFISYMSYYVFGYMLSYKDIKKRKYIFAIGYVLGSIAVFIFTHILTLSGVTNNLYFFSFTNPIVFITSISFFLWIKTYDIGKKTKQFIHKLIPYIMGVYLIHPVILLVFLRVFSLSSSTYLFLTPWITFVVYGVSLGVLSLMVRIPYLSICIGFPQKKQ